MPTASNGGSPIIDYKIYWDNGVGNGNFDTVLASTTYPSLEYTASGLTEGTYYSFKITAVNIVDESLKSTSGRFLASDLPGIPGTPVKVSADANQITISWTAPSSDGGSDLLLYHVYIDGVKHEDITTPTTTYTFSTPTTGQLYAFTVSSSNYINEGSQSTSVSIIAATVPEASTSAPTKVSASSSHIEVNWLAPADGGSIIMGYLVYVDGVSSASLVTQASVTTLSISNSVVSLTSGQDYSISVAAYNAVGIGA